MKKTYKSKRFGVVVCILLVVASFATSGGVLAKYIHTARKESSSVTAKTFYFESDYLVENSSPSPYKLSAGNESVSFSLCNYSGALISGVDCVYTVTVTTDDPSVTLNGMSGKTLALSATANEKASLTVALGGLEPSYTYSVTATANGGYVKTLYAKFSVAASQDGFYMNLFDNTAQGYLLLTVWTEDLTGTLAVSFPAGLIPDSTDPMLQDCHNYNGETYLAGSFTDAESFSANFSSRAYRFFKTSSYDPSSDFTVTMDGKTAVESTIP